MNIDNLVGKGIKTGVTSRIQPAMITLHFILPQRLDNLLV